MLPFGQVLLASQVSAGAHVTFELHGREAFPPSTDRDHALVAGEHRPVVSRTKIRLSLRKWGVAISARGLFAS